MVLDAVYPPKTKSPLGWDEAEFEENHQKQLLNSQCCLQTPVKKTVS